MYKPGSLKIFLPKRLSETGGTSTFARNFKHELEKRGHSVTFTFKPDYDLLLVSPTTSLRYLLHAKINHRPIIHRLDGTYYPGSSAGWLWLILNLQLAIIRNLFADTIIYQSQFSQQSCNTALNLTPKLKDQQSTIIYNGVDTGRFSPHGTQISLRNNPNQHLFITASRFRTEDQIIPLLTTFSHYRHTYHENSKLVIIGPFQEHVTHIPEQYKNQKGVTFIGAKSNQKLPSYLRSADIFVMTHKTPPCPNNVLEAMSSGLPICGIADGAMPELVTTGTEGELIPEPSQWYPLSTQALAKKLHLIKQNQKPMPIMLATEPSMTSA